jgi:hypothetical protein
VPVGTAPAAADVATACGAVAAGTAAALLPWLQHLSLLHLSVLPSRWLSLLLLLRPSLPLPLSLLLLLLQMP